MVIESVFRPAAREVGAGQRELGGSTRRDDSKRASVSEALAGCADGGGGDGVVLRLVSGLSLVIAAEERYYSTLRLSTLA